MGASAGAGSEEAPAARPRRAWRQPSARARFFTNASIVSAWPRPASFWLTAQNTSGESAAASGEDLDPTSVRDGAHVRERAFSDVSDRLPNGAAPMGSYRVAGLPQALGRAATTSVGRRGARRRTAGDQAGSVTHVQSHCPASQARISHDITLFLINSNNCEPDLMPIWDDAISFAVERCWESPGARCLPGEAWGQLRRRPRIPHR